MSFSGGVASGGGGGSVLPTIKVAVDYTQQKENITNFLRFVKGTVPPLSVNADRTTDVLGAVSSMDVDGEEQDDETESVLESIDSMDLDNHTSSRRRRKQANSFKYMEQLQRITNREQKALIVDLKDLQEFLNAQMRGSGTELAIAIELNALHYVELISECIDVILSEMTPTIDISHKDDVLDVIIHQRQERNARQSQGQSMGPETMQSANDGDEQTEQDQNNLPFPPSLLRRYTVYLKPLSAQGRDAKPMAVRSIRAEHIGALVTLRGIVTRVSEVKPYLQVDAYACDVCGAEVFQEIKGRQYMPLTECPGECKSNKVKGSLFQQVRASKFVPFQEIKIQEMTDQVPVGHIPRMMTINMSGPLTRSLNPGDVCDVSGIFLPTPYTGFKAVRAGLLTDTFLQAQHVCQLRKSYSALEGELTTETSERIRSLSREGDVYDKLAASIAPEIYGHEDVKKCLLLLLVGGVTRDMPDGMHIRGDINVCLMGDPGVAKSQLLKYISKIAPRGVYTTGRGSSGVGLTAAVMRDPVTEEMVLEGGALVLADNGIACIDEFDKMEESDRTAIHEVMEQQTISISKAGISTTLNARTSILAAANPLYGRYNPRISPVDNINLPAALLSRFDILFLILDTPSREDDERLAQHVAYVHMHSEHPPLTFEPLEPQLMKHYIARARQYQPNVTKSVSEYLVSAYVKLRNQTKDDEERGQAYTYTSARTLLGIVRMSQALARLRFSEQVEIGDVDEALRLLDVSKSSLTVNSRRENGIQDGTTNDFSSVTKIYRIIRDMAMTVGHEGRDSIRESKLRGKPIELPAGVQEDETWLHEENAPGPLSMRVIRERIIAAGWVEDQLQDCLREYEDLGVIQVVNGNRLIFL